MTWPKPSETALVSSTRSGAIEEISKSALTTAPSSWLLQVYTERVSGPGGEAVRLETLVANLLSLVTVPAPGAAPARFSLGAGDRQLVT